MNKLLIVLLISILNFSISKAQNPLLKQWDYRFGGNEVEWPMYMQQTFDGGYVLGGSSESDSSGDKTQNNWSTLHPDYWIIKIDSLGNKQWDKTFGGIGAEWFRSLDQTHDGGYILGGWSNSGISGDKSQPNWDTSLATNDYWIVKVDSLGNKQWDKRFGGNADDNMFSLQQTTDHGYLLGGDSYSGISGDKTQSQWGTPGSDIDMWIVKIDSLGIKQWDKRFGGSGGDGLNRLQQTIDGGYVLGGSSNSGISGDKTQPSWGFFDFWIVKINSVGIKLWDKRFGGLHLDALLNLQQSTDGGYILGGISQSDSSGDKTEPSQGGLDCWLVKVDSIGNKQWDKDFGGTSTELEFHNISQTNDGGYFLACESLSPAGGDKSQNNLGSSQSWILKMDSLGNKQWDKTIFTPGYDYNRFSIQTRDQCYAVLISTFAGVGGDKSQPSRGTYDYWLIKFCDSTLMTSTIPISDNQYPISIFPNPSTDQIILRTSLLLNEAVTISIVNIHGEILTEEKVQWKNETIVDIKTLSRGIYLLKLQGEKKSWVVKFVRE